MEPRAHIPPPQIQTIRDSPTEPACSNTPLGEMNIPEPMMFPVMEKRSFSYLLMPEDTKIHGRLSDVCVYLCLVSTVTEASRLTIQITLCQNQNWKYLKIVSIRRQSLCHRFSEKVIKMSAQKCVVNTVKYFVVKIETLRAMNTT